MTIPKAKKQLHSTPVSLDPEVAYYTSKTTTMVVLGIEVVEIVLYLNSMEVARATFHSSGDTTADKNTAIYKAQLMEQKHKRELQREEHKIPVMNYKSFLLMS